MLEKAIMEVWAPVRLDRPASMSPTSPTSKDALATKSPKIAPATSSTLSEISNVSTIESKPQHDRKPSKNGKLASRQVPQKPLYIREGGSIPAIRFLEQEF